VGTEVGRIAQRLFELEACLAAVRAASDTRPMTASECTAARKCRKTRRYSPVPPLVPWDDGTRPWRTRPTGAHPHTVQFQQLKSRGLVIRRDRCSVPSNASSVLVPAEDLIIPGLSCIFNRKAGVNGPTFVL
jgi:hypothetical protein